MVGPNVKTAKRKKLNCIRMDAAGDGGDSQPATLYNTNLGCARSSITFPQRADAGCRATDARQPVWASGLFAVRNRN